MSSVGPEMMSGVRASSMRIEVHLIYDREIERPLDHLIPRVFHVVAQVIETELVVRRVCDVGVIGVAPLLVGEVRDNHSNRHPEEAIDLAHPFGVATGEIVVDRHNVDALAFKRIEIDGKGRDQRLALTRLHFRDFAAVKRNATDQLHVIMTLAEGADGRLADRRKRFGKQIFQLLTTREPLPEDVRLPTQFVVGQRGNVRLETVDRIHIFAKSAHIAIVGRSEDALCQSGDHGIPLKTRAFVIGRNPLADALGNCRGRCKEPPSASQLSGGDCSWA